MYTYGLDNSTLTIKILLESNHLKSTISVRRLAVAFPLEPIQAASKAPPPGCAWSVSLALPTPGLHNKIPA